MHDHPQMLNSRCHHFLQGSYGKLPLVYVFWRVPRAGPSLTQTCDNTASGVLRFHVVSPWLPSRHHRTRTEARPYCVASHHHLKGNIGSVVIVFSFEEKELKKINQGFFCRINHCLWFARWKPWRVYILYSCVLRSRVCIAWLSRLSFFKQCIT